MQLIFLDRHTTSVGGPEGWWWFISFSNYYHAAVVFIFHSFSSYTLRNTTYIKLLVKNNGYSSEYPCSHLGPALVGPFSSWVVISSKASDMRSTKKGIAEWINEKSEPFVCSALKPSPQKHRSEKIKYTFDLT